MTPIFYVKYVVNFFVLFSIIKMLIILKTILVNFIFSTKKFQVIFFRTVLKMHHLFFFFFAYINIFSFSKRAILVTKHSLISLTGDGFSLQPNRRLVQAYLLNYTTLPNRPSSSHLRLSPSLEMAMMQTATRLPHSTITSVSPMIPLQGPPSHLCFSHSPMTHQPNLLFSTTNTRPFSLRPPRKLLCTPPRGKYVREDYLVVCPQITKHALYWFCLLYHFLGVVMCCFVGLIWLHRCSFWFARKWRRKELGFRFLIFERQKKP